MTVNAPQPASAAPATPGSATPANASPAPSKKFAIAAPARLKGRHFGVLISFAVAVILPTIVSAFYLFVIASDQFSSRVSFSIRSEEFANPLEALGALGQISTGTSSDASILNEFLRSQKLIEDLVNTIPLVEIYSRPEGDYLFSFNPDRPIEDLLRFWNRTNKISYNANTGLINFEAVAFSPEDAHTVASAVLEVSSNLVDLLSNVAREDTTRHAAYELDQAGQRLTEIRKELRELRIKEQVVDPSADLGIQMGVLTALQQQLANVLIEHDLLLGSTRPDDPRIATSQARIDAIQSRITQEREKLGDSSHSGQSDLSTVVGEYEVLLADREFAEQAFAAARATYDTAQAEARRKSRYLVAHVPPTLAESSQYPKRFQILFLAFCACTMVWLVGVLTIYAMADRR